jgi:HD-GYP domain-containing protein (c-di-GMP phosphodiesterase class II)
VSRNAGRDRRTLARCKPFGNLLRSLPAIRHRSVNVWGAAADTRTVTLSASASMSRQPDSQSEIVRVSEVLAALSFALDLTEGQPMGHALRTCLIGMDIADRLGLPLGDSRDLYYALLLKDVGCSSNSSRVFELFGGDERTTRHALRLVDWSGYFKALRFGVAYAGRGASWFERSRRIVSLARLGTRAANELVETRAARGAEIVGRLGFGPQVAEAIRSLDERWDGGGHPRGLRGGEIPLLARIISLAQVLEVHSMVDGPRPALAVVQSRRRQWFDPTLVAGCSGLEDDLARWCTLDEEGLRQAVREREPGGAALLAGPGTLDRIAYGFAEIVDAKSPFTASHSFRVTKLSLRIAARLGETPHGLGELKRAALLHDIGKLSVPNSILDKPAPLNPEEWDTVRMHPYYTQRILEHIRGLEQLAFVAASHHERLDGGGYFRGLRAEQIPFGSRVLAAADIYDALSTARPYRPAMPEDVAFRIMERDRDVGIWGECLDALVDLVGKGEDPRTLQEERMVA